MMVTSKPADDRKRSGDYDERASPPPAGKVTGTAINLESGEL